MGDKNRSTLMATLVSRHFPKAKKVLAVADGDGSLANRLANKGYDVIAVEAHPRQAKSRKGVDYRKGYFSHDDKIEADVIVGMHPDEATTPIIKWAIKNRKPFAVCPCCIKGDGANAVHTYSGWLKYLKSLGKRAGYQVLELQLKMNGKNIVLVGKP